jgi:hypothetical protein
MSRRTTRAVNPLDALLMFQVGKSITRSFLTSGQAEWIGVRLGPRSPPVLSLSPQLLRLNLSISAVKDRPKMLTVPSQNNTLA